MKKIFLLAFILGLTGCSQTWKIEKKPYRANNWVDGQVVDVGHRPSIADASEAICHGKDQEPEDRIRYTNATTGETLVYSCQEIYRYRLEKAKEREARSR